MQLRKGIFTDIWEQYTASLAISVDSGELPNQCETHIDNINNDTFRKI